MENTQIFKEDESGLNNLIDENLSVSETVSRINELPLAMPEAVENAISNLTVAKKKNKTSVFSTPARNCKTFPASKKRGRKKPEKRAHGAFLKILPTDT